MQVILISNRIATISFEYRSAIDAHSFHLQGRQRRPATVHPVPAHRRRLTVAVLLAGAQATPVLAATGNPKPAHSLGNYNFSIAQQPLVSALNAFTSVTGWQIGLPAELGQGVASPGVRGALTPEKALEQLLNGTNLSYRKLGENNVVLEKRTSGATLNLQQVTISATRQEQDVSSVPNTVTVQDRQQLDRQNVNNIRQLVRHEPGVSVSGAGLRGGGISGYNIRGIDGDRILTPGQFLQRALCANPSQLRRPGNRQARGNPPRPGLGALWQQRHRRRGQLLHP